MGLVGGRWPPTPPKYYYHNFIPWALFTWHKHFWRKHCSLLNLYAWGGRVRSFQWLHSFLSSANSPLYQGKKYCRQERNSKVFKKPNLQLELFFSTQQNINRIYFISLYTSEILFLFSHKLQSRCEFLCPSNSLIEHLHNFPFSPPLQHFFLGV